MKTLFLAIFYAGTLTSTLSFLNNFDSKNLDDTLSIFPIPDEILATLQ